MQAFQATWAATCKVEASTMVVPANYIFYVGPISFSGPYCTPNIIFQVNATTKSKISKQHEHFIILNYKNKEKQKTR
jgi:hypothetical protein